MEELTYLQKVAIKGEVALTLSTCSHDAEMKVRAYYMIKGTPAQFKPVVVEFIKEAVTFDETIIDRIYLEEQNGTVPLWLWIDLVIADLKLSLTAPDNTVRTGSLSVSKEKERKKLIESAFVTFARKAVIVSPTAANKLFNSILDNYDLEFLHSACTYLKSCCPEVQFFKKDKRIPESIMQCRLDLKSIMSFIIETKTLSMTDSQGGMMAVESTNDCADSIQAAIESMFNIDTILQNQPQKTVYTVKKVFKDSGMSIDLRTCKTEQEAIEYVKRICEEYPDLLNTCEFQIHMERIYEDKKTGKIKRET